MREKYTPKIKGTKTPGDGKQGRYSDPKYWSTGPDPVIRDMYYGFLKHRAQARFRSEPYSLTWEDWQCLWNKDSWQHKGKQMHSLTLTRVCRDLPWDLSNCVVCERRLINNYGRRSEDV